SSRRRHTRSKRDWSSDVCSSDLVIAAATNVHTWVELGAALTDEDLARLDLLATEALNTETLCLGVATVTGARSTLLSCHESPSSGRSRAPAHSARTRLGRYLMPVRSST